MNVALAANGDDTDDQELMTGATRRAERRRRGRRRRGDDCPGEADDDIARQLCTENCERKIAVGENLALDYWQDK